MDEIQSCIHNLPSDVSVNAHCIMGQSIWKNHALVFLDSAFLDMGL